MTEAIVEKEFCSACGADVRPQADYCYNCGVAVSDSAAKKEPFPPAEVSAVDNLTHEKVIDEKPEKNADAAIKKDVIETVAAETPEAEKNFGSQIPAKLTSAAAMRRKSKSFERKTVEVVWEEHDSAPNVWFISAAVFLALVAIGILFLAIHLK